MKQCFIICMLFSITYFTSCKKGDTGPAGANGNANVSVFHYGSRTFTGSVVYDIPVSRAQMDNSFILAYYNPSTEAATAWYPVPGLGSSGAYEMRYFTYQDAVNQKYVFSVRAMQPGSATPYANELTFTKFRIFLVPASDSTTMAKTASVDFNNYKAVCTYYNIDQ